METNFLTRIVEQKRSKLERKKQERPLVAEQVVRPAAKKPSNQRPFFLALDRNDRLNFIAEIKRASPSRGLLRAYVDPGELGVTYESHGAAAISVLTEEDHFLGSLEDLKLVKQSVSCPILRKDFIIDPYQVYEASAAGADAILLIAAILDATSLSHLSSVAEHVGLSIIVEVHNQAELERAVACGAEIIGINNRDLASLRVDLHTSLQLAPQVPDSTILVSESGISTADDVRLLREAGVDAFLIGEYLMRSPHPGKSLRELMIRSLN